jgi:hypothetical protein
MTFKAYPVTVTVTHRHHERSEMNASYRIEDPAGRTRRLSVDSAYGFRIATAGKDTKAQAEWLLCEIVNERTGTKH